MRELGFPVEFNPSSRRGLLVSVHTGPSHTALEFISKEFVTEPLMTFLGVLAQWKGLGNNVLVSALDERVLGIEAPTGLVSEPWQVASILGLIDCATFIQDIYDNPFITSVSVDTGGLPGLSLESALEDMERFAASCAGELSNHLGDGFRIEGALQTDWPADADQYFFDITLTLSEPLAAGASHRVRKLFEGIEISLAGTAFEARNTPEYLYDEGLIPFPVRVEIAESEIHYAIETPPSDISIPLILIRDTLTLRHHANISGWKVLVRERW